jgi:CubicO group peptidase (beta-lactamase class C family)
VARSSGLPDSWPGSHALRRRRAPLAEYTAEAAAVGLLFDPGADVSYSSVALDLAAAAAERAAGLPLPRLLAERLFDPLGMADRSSVRRGGPAARLPCADAWSVGHWAARWATPAGTRPGGVGRRGER